MLRLSCISSDVDKAQDLYHQIVNQYTIYDPQEADVIIIIGGDGELLHNIHKYMDLKKPFYPINGGTIGFLTNNYPINLQESIMDSKATLLHPLEMNAEDINGQKHKALAINEAYIFRTSHRAAKFSIKVNDILRMEEMIGDGAMVATPAGSSAYNLSAGGHIVPLESNILSLTAICPFRPRRWKGALLDSKSKVSFDILSPQIRSVSAVADFQEFPNIKYMEVYERSDLSIELLFDKNHALEDRIIKEQFWED